MGWLSKATRSCLCHGIWPYFGTDDVSEVAGAASRCAKHVGSMEVCEARPQRAKRPKASPNTCAFLTVATGCWGLIPIVDTWGWASFFKGHHKEPTYFLLYLLFGEKWGGSALFKTHLILGDLACLDHLVGQGLRVEPEVHPHQAGVLGERGTPDAKNRGMCVFFCKKPCITLEMAKCPRGINSVQLTATAYGKSLTDLAELRLNIGQAKLVLRLR